MDMNKTNSIAIQYMGCTNFRVFAIKLLCHKYSFFVIFNSLPVGVHTLIFKEIDMKQRIILPVTKSNVHKVPPVNYMTIEPLKIIQ